MTDEHFAPLADPPAVPLAPGAADQLTGGVGALLPVSPAHSQEV